MNNLIKDFINIYNSKSEKDVISTLNICSLSAHVYHQEGSVTGVALDSSVNLVYSSNYEVT